MTDRNIIQRGELNMRLLRGLEVRQRAGEGLLLADQVVPCVTLEDLTKQSLAVEPGERRAYASSGIIPAVAAQFGGMAVQNPVGSGALIAIRGFNISTSTTQQHVIGIADISVLATLQTPWWSDPRNTGIPFAVVKSGSPGASNILTELTRVNMGTTTCQNLIAWPPDFAIVLVEGQAFGIQSAVANQATTISLIWDEIPLR